MDVWKSGRPITRVYPRHYGARGFNPTLTSARFRPLRDRRGHLVPTAYGAADQETALAEALLRGVEALQAGRRRRLYLREVRGLNLATIWPTVDLRLARLHGQGLQRLSLLREHLIDCDESSYPYTAEWAQALYDCPTDLAGIVWTSRQNDSGKALVLWQGVIEPKTDLWTDGTSIPLDSEPGIDLVRQACAYAGIDFEG